MNDNGWDDLIDANKELRTMRREFKKQTAGKRRASARGRATQRKGKVGELAAEQTLRAMGFRFIKPVGKHVHLTPIDARRGIYLVKFVSTLPGDFTAVGDNGRSVLVEVKHINDRDVLRWSDLRKGKNGLPGQPESLNAHHEAGGMSLLVWVNSTPNVIVMDWPIPGFGPGRAGSLSLERAIELDVT